MWARIDRLIAAHPYIDNLSSFVTNLLDHVQQGIYRSGAWERDWLAQCVPAVAIDVAYDPAEDPIGRLPRK